mgnify:CR=1 FL=1
MGMFDTLILQEPVICPDCGSKIDSVQTKVFDNCLDTYEPGDITKGSRIITGIIAETLFCGKCHWPKDSNDGHVFIAIWHSIYVGIFKSEDEAERIINSIDRLDLIQWLDKAQNERNLWHGRFNSLYSEVSALNDYEKAEDKEAYLSKPFNIFRNKELLESDDPLESILQKNKFHSRKANGDMFED